MILFLNGTFGVGKSTAAEMNVERIPLAALYAPELVVETARLLLAEYGRTLVIPMTIWRRDRFERLVDGLHTVESDLRLLHLTASEETLRSRILGRPESEGNHGWCLKHLEACLEASKEPTFGTRIKTDGRIPAEIAGEILDLSGLTVETRRTG
ncbi:MAG: AAA family ATPase [Rubrobacteraceae bacterium]